MKPVVQALLLAERIWRVQEGGYIISGTFTGMELENHKPVTEVPDEDGITYELPAGGSSGAPWVYISLTDVCNNTELQVQFTCLKKNRQIFGRPLSIECHDRLATVQIALPLPNLIPFINKEGDGYYAVEVICESEIIGSYRFKTSVRGLRNDNQTPGEQT